MLSCVPMLFAGAPFRRYLPQGEGFPQGLTAPSRAWSCSGSAARNILWYIAASATPRKILRVVTLAASLFVLAAALPARAQQGLPPIQKMPHLFVQTEILGIRNGITRSLGKGNIEAFPGRPGTLTVPIDLGSSSADHPTSLEIEVTQNAVGEPKIGLTVATTITVTSRTGDVSRIRRERVAEVDEGRSFFHQAYDNAAQGTSVLLTLTPETRIVPQLVKPSMSAPILFNVSLSRVTPGGAVPLEDNVLRTLENSPVSYAFRIARAAATPVEATKAADAPPDSAQVTGSEPAVPAADAPAVPIPVAPESATNAAGEPKDAKDSKGKKKKPKKMSKKERERETLAQFKASREAQDAQAQGSQPAEESTTSGAPADPGGAPAPVDAPAGDPATAPGGAPGTVPDSAAPSDATAAPPAADELELTLLPHRVESGILMVEASLRGRTPGSGGAERATLVQRTQAITSNGSFDITVTGLGPAGAGSYRFSVQARF